MDNFIVERSDLKIVIDKKKLKYCTKKDARQVAKHLKKVGFF